MNLKFHILATIVLLSGFWSVASAEVGFHPDWKNALKPKGTPAADSCPTAFGLCRSKSRFIGYAGADSANQNEYSFPLCKRKRRRVFSRRRSLSS